MQSQRSCGGHTFKIHVCLHLGTCIQLSSALCLESRSFPNETLIHAIRNTAQVRFIPPDATADRFRFRSSSPPNRGSCALPPPAEEGTARPVWRNNKSDLSTKEISSISADD